jgi:hypothetical protein
MLQSQASGDRPLGDTLDFSLVVGGPLFRLLRRAHLSDDALTLVGKRILASSLVTWVPLLGLSALGGRMLGGSAAVPFLLDLDVHVRFLLATPLLIGAELVVHQRMRPVVEQFLERRLIPDGAIGRFEAAIVSAFRLRDSILLEVALIAFVYAVGILVIWRRYAVIDTDTWYATPVPGGTSLTLAGMWLSYVSLPIFQFLLCRWYLRLFIWARFLWQVSRVELRLVPTHPDRVAGLGFLSSTVYAFTPLAAAHGAVLGGLLANRIFYVGAGLPDFKVEIAVVVALMLCLTLGPLLVFAPQLTRAKRIGQREYGRLAERYVREFDGKWLRGGASDDDALMGSADIQSLADMGNSFEVIRTMRVVPVARQDVLRIVAATLAPLVPLSLTMMPFEELVKVLFGLLV